MEEKKPWFEKAMRCKPDRVVVKLKNEDGSFKDAINIPTVYWPLNGKYEVFHWDNTEHLRDEAILSVIDGQDYQIGHCYTNAEAITGALRQAGYNARLYVGWLFTGENEYPIHHAWTVLDGKYIIDLCDDFGLKLADSNRVYFENAQTKEQLEDLLVDFTKWASQYPHSKRCFPVGKPSRILMYIGCECTKEEGIMIYNNLSKKYPNHPCNEKVRYSNGMTGVQKKMADAGLMKNIK